MPTADLRQEIEAGLTANGHHPLESLVRTARFIGTPWRLLATQISDKSGVTVSYQTLINWFPDLNKPAYQLASADPA